MELPLNATEEDSKRTISNMVMDVVAPPPPESADSQAEPEQAAAEPPQEPNSQPQKPAKSKETSTKPNTAGVTGSKQRSSDVTVAIIATVIIVLGLAVLAVLAFLKQK